MSITSNLIRTGIVSDRNESEAAVRIVMEDRDGMVSDWLPIVVPPLVYDDPEYPITLKIPEVGTTVLCLFLGTGLEAGFCLGQVGV